MSFSTWCQRFLQHYFGPHSVGDLIRLIVTDEILDYEFGDLGGKIGFLKATLSGPEWPRSRIYGPSWPDSLSERGLSLHEQWQQPHRRHPQYPALLHDGPPYLPYLVLLSLAWTQEVDCPGHAFYPRLSQLYPDHRMDEAAAGRIRMALWQPLWAGLETWSSARNSLIGRWQLERLGQMEHIGIPKSQVILTPGRLDRLPKLFSAAGLQPGAQLQESDLRSCLMGCGIAQYELGHTIWQEIGPPTPLGLAALARIGEQLVDWDGTVPQEFARAREGEVYDEIELLFALKPTNGGYCLWFGCVDDSGCVDIALTTGPLAGCVLSPAANDLAILKTNEGCAVDASTCVNANPDGLVANGVLRSESAGVRNACVRLRNKPLHILRWQNDSRVYVESDNLPMEGGVYVLVSPGNRATWRHWVEPVAGRIKEVCDQEATGLPRGYILVWVGNLALLTDEERLGIPDGRVGSRNRPRLVRLRGGSRVVRGQSGRVYLPYDPPHVLVDAQGPLEWACDGCTVREVVQQGEAGMGGDHQSGTRVFSADVAEGATSVLIRCLRGGDQVGIVRFRLASDVVDAVGVCQQQALRMDSIGHRAEGHGLQGVIVTGGEEDQTRNWAFQVVQADRNPVSVTEAAVDHSSFCFLESLCAHGRRMALSEFRRRAVEILDLGIERFNEEFRWMCNLGFADIEYDRKGRWAYVHPGPFCIYMLPERAGGCYQAVVTGVATREKWRTLLAAARVKDVGVVQRHNGSCRMMPPTTVLLHQSIATLRDLAEDSACAFLAHPPAERIASWAGDLESWERGLCWLEGIGPDHDGVYVPATFETIDARGSPLGGYEHILYRMTDRETRRHVSAKLVVRSADKGASHAIVAERSWGRWKAHGSALRYIYRHLASATGGPVDANPVMVPWERRHKRIILPKALILPYVLARALSLCTGVVPKQVKSGCMLYRDSKHMFVAGPGYEGPCIVYEDVPLEIARTIFNKVGAGVVVVDESATSECYCIPVSS